MAQHRPTLTRFVRRIPLQLPATHGNRKYKSIRWKPLFQCPLCDLYTPDHPFATLCRGEPQCTSNGKPSEK